LNHKIYREIGVVNGGATNTRPKLNLARNCAVFQLGFVLRLLVKQVVNSHWHAHGISFATNVGKFTATSQCAQRLQKKVDV
jgi:hypothetical protein